MFGRKKKDTHEPEIVFDPARHKAILRCSICTGEQVLKFKDMQSGVISEVSLVRNDRELEELKKKYGITEITKEY